MRLVEDIYNDRKPDSADLGKVLEDYGVPVEIISYIWTLHRRKIDGVRPPDNIIVASRKKAEVLQAYDDIQQKNMSLNKGEIIKRTASRLGRSVSYVENHLKS